MNDKREHHHVAVQVVKKKGKSRESQTQKSHLDVKVSRRNAARTMEVTSGRKAKQMVLGHTTDLKMTFL